MRIALVLSLALLACRKNVEEPLDLDGDGFAAAEDCDDTDQNVFPGADERCNGVDDDCDGETDEDPVDATAWYLDGDGDGFGAPDDELLACTQPEGRVSSSSDCDDTDAGTWPGAPEACDDPIDRDCDGVGGAEDGDGDGYAGCADCDDTDPDVHPDADEHCDGLDEDCDGVADEDPVDAPTWYVDLDGDGHGDDDRTLAACEQPLDTSDVGGDCNDLDPGSYPGADEVCDGLDNDCDGTPDEDAVGGTVWYVDADGDGWGDDATAAAACSPPDGGVLRGGDCDDTSAAVWPGALEVCDTLDNDCDGTPDDGAVDAPTWYADADGDGHGDASAAARACTAPTGTVASDDDCDDTRAARYPGHPEVCDTLDNDCDGRADEDAADADTWHPDADGDGYGSPAWSVDACAAPDGYVLDATDCDDAHAAANPDGAEVCDGLDNDCDGTADVGASDAPTWYADADGDGYGDAAVTAVACEAPAGHVADATDCDDDAPSAHPGGVEVCDGLDDDCDGAVDDGALDAEDWWTDGDGDTWGAGAPTAACTAPAGTVGRDGDCDDADATAWPGAAETCDGADDDCDGTVDEDATDAGTWYRDADADGYGTAGFPVVACDAPAGTVADATDCDDLHAAAWPGAAEVCDGLDNDCDGGVDLGATDAPTWYADGDGDGHGALSSPAVQCSAPAGHVANARDCDDTSAARHPGALEVCDGADDDCDGTPDDGAVDAPWWYADGDGDGHGAGAGARACAAPIGAVDSSDDCDDADGSRYPGATETCDGDDDDCDGTVDEDATDADPWYRDLDADGYPGDVVVELACASPGAGWGAAPTDCDDVDRAVHPGATEVCNRVDDDCDGTVDGPGADGVTTFYADDDADGWGDAADVTLACFAPSGHAAAAGDCDDADPLRHPGRVDVPGTGVDEACDGVDLDAELVVASRSDGTLRALDPDSGRPLWTLSGLGELIDVTLAEDGRMWVSRYVAGTVAEVARDGTVTDVVTGLTNPHGLWWDEDLGLLYINDTVADRVLSYDPATGTSAVLATGLSAPIDAVRPDGWTDLVVTQRDSPELLALDPSTGVTRVLATFPDSLDLLALAGSDSWYVTSYSAGDLYHYVPSTGAITTELDEPDHALFGLCAHPDGERVVLPRLDDHRVDQRWPTGALAAWSRRVSDATVGCEVNLLRDADEDGVLAAWAGGEDCDDLDPDAWPGATPGCDDRDLDCDGLVDADADGDGLSSSACGGSDPDDADPDVPLYRTCADVLDAGLSHGSDLYTLDLDGDGTGEDAYCDMATDGGGWTVVYAATGADGEVPMVSDTGRTGDPLDFAHYNLPWATKHTLATLSSESLFLRPDGRALLADAPLYDGVLGDHWHQAVTVESDGAYDAAWLGYSRANISGGGDYNVSFDGATCSGTYTASQGVDHHSTSYYHLNCGCERHYLYSYSNVVKDDDAGYDVHSALGSWTATDDCNSAEGGALVFRAAMR